jgi:multimeric flavodoxin WrbA
VRIVIAEDDTASRLMLEAALEGLQSEKVEATIIRLLRFLTIIARGSCGQVQPPGPFGR